MKVLVCGGRHFADAALCKRTLDALHVGTPITCLIEGGARGADELAGAWAMARGVRQRTFEADWRRDGVSAGPIRNQAMLREGDPDLVVAFPGGAGTAHMISIARRAGVRVIEVEA
jgi:hypothetical protein